MFGSIIFCVFLTLFLTFMDKFNTASAMHEDTREEMLKKDRAIKEASKELDRFNKKAYNYIQARKLMKQAE